MASGYLNLPKHYEDALISGAHPRSSISVLTAAPSANGFFGAAGISGALPLAYSEIERAFFEKAAAAGRSGAPSTSGALASSTGGGGGVSIYEYERPGWTFHAKGTWHVRRRWLAPVAAMAASAEPRRPSAAPLSVSSFVGSSNFGRRSVDRDVELQVEIETADGALSQRLCDERDALFSGGRKAPAAVEVGVGDAAAPPAPAADWVRHVGGEVWAQPSRQLRGWSWASGLWVHGGWRFFKYFM